MIEPTYSAYEMMAVVGARELNDGEVAFIGTGLPMLAAQMALYTHAPRLVIIYESGYVGCHNIHTARLVGDIRFMKGLTMLSSMVDVLGFLQTGVIDVGFLGGAQVDQFGNINATVVGPYEKPLVRLPGGGGANEIASCAKRTIITMNHDTRRFPKKVDYITSPGYLDGSPDARKKAGLIGDGPDKVITDLAVLDFDEKTHRMRIESLHPGITVEDVQSRTGFELVVPRRVEETAPPTEEELRILREAVDPTGFYIKRRAERKAVRAGV
ncbi:MAG: glutaconate CoA-transferase [Chloroflexi bacterium]|nr:glutaconate CoA-transferase [Chloroflexota bacterium]